jgi:hypothetical protein
MAGLLGSLLVKPFFKLSGAFSAHYAICFRYLIVFNNKPAVEVRHHPSQMLHVYNGFAVDAKKRVRLQNFAKGV